MRQLGTVAKFNTYDQQSSHLRPEESKIKIVKTKMHEVQEADSNIEHNLTLAYAKKAFLPNLLKKSGPHGCTLSLIKKGFFGVHFSNQNMSNMTKVYNTLEGQWSNGKTGKEVV